MGKVWLHIRSPKQSGGNTSSMEFMGLRNSPLKQVKTTFNTQSTSRSTCSSFSPDDQLMPFEHLCFLSSGSGLSWHRHSFSAAHFAAGCQSVRTGWKYRSRFRRRLFSGRTRTGRQKPRLVGSRGRSAARGRPGQNRHWGPRRSPMGRANCQDHGEIGWGKHPNPCVRYSMSGESIPPM